MNVKTRLLTLAILVTSLFGIVTAQTTTQDGKLTITYGLTARDRPRNPEAGKASQKGTLSFNLNLTDRFTFGMDLDTFLSKHKKDNSRVTGYGNTFLNFGYDAVKEGQHHPALSLSYSIKLPTADPTRGLGSGRTDHQVMGSLARSQLGNTQRTSVLASMGFNFAGLSSSKTDRARVGVLVLRLDRILDNTQVKKYIFRSELNATSHAKQTASEIFINNSVQVTFNAKLKFRGTVRTGITANSSRIGVVGALTYTTNIFR